MALTPEHPEILLFVPPDFQPESLCPLKNPASDRGINREQLLHGAFGADDGGQAVDIAVVQDFKREGDIPVCDRFRPFRVPFVVLALEQVSMYSALQPFTALICRR